MQLTKLVKICLVLLCIFSLSLSLTVQNKNTIENTVTISNEDMASTVLNNEIERRLKNSKSNNQYSNETNNNISSNIPKIPTVLAPFSAINTIKLIKDLSKYVMNTGSTPSDMSKFGSILAGCTELLSNNKQFALQLESFWNNAANVASGASKWDNKILINLIGLVGANTVSYMGSNVSCSSGLTYQQNPDEKKIMEVLTQTEYFGGFATPSGPKPPFIEGMFSNHRDSLPSDAFLKLNEASRASIPDSSSPTPEKNKDTNFVQAITNKA